MVEKLKKLKAERKAGAAPRRASEPLERGPVAEQIHELLRHLDDDGIDPRTDEGGRVLFFMLGQRVNDRCRRCDSVLKRFERLNHHTCWKCSQRVLSQLEKEAAV